MIARTLSKKKLQKNKRALVHLEHMMRHIQSSFRQQGVAIPYPVPQGISLDNYYIVKNRDAFYTIYDSHNRVVVDQINLPETAILVANDLSVGRMINNDLLDKDTKYGYLVFKQQICNRSIGNCKKTGNLDKMELMIMHSQAAFQKAKNIRMIINKQYKNLQSKINNLNTSGTKHEYK
jgi:hypothetical protein